MPPRAARGAQNGQNGHAPQQQNGHANADGPRMPPLRRSESSASDSSLPDLASASSSESESEHEGADPRPPRRAPPNGAAPAVAVAPEPEPEPEPEPVPDRVENQPSLNRLDGVAAHSQISHRNR